MSMSAQELFQQMSSAGGGSAREFSTTNSQWVDLNLDKDYSAYMDNEQAGRPVYEFFQNWWDTMSKCDVNGH